MTPDYVQEIQTAIRGEGLDGWLFCNFRHRDPLADRILGINPTTTNSRLWFYAIPGGENSGESLCAILHAIEPDSLGPALPGQRLYYRSRDELLARLSALAGKRWGCHFSDSIPAVSFLDAGTAALLQQAGLHLVSAAGLLQRFEGLLGPADTESHERAAEHLYDIVEIAWAAVQKAFAAAMPLYEGDIQRLMLDEFSARNLVCGHPPIVASGFNSSNPHYQITHNGALIKHGDLIQFDLWAKEAGPNGIYADISWVGVYAETPSPSGASVTETAFNNVVEARETALRFIGDQLRKGNAVSGADVDRVTRQALARCGCTEAIRHRTGHGIDREVHGCGVNMDSVEFPDARPILEGSCFSLEPGIYFEQFGMRTEIDVYIANGTPVVSGKQRQFTLLHC